MLGKTKKAPNAKTKPIKKNNFTILVHNYSILNLLIIFNRELNPVIVYQTHIDDSIPDEHTPHY